ncbi:hypothetical protein AB0890_35035 [Streptomyces sp. NPDC005406]|uniref:hypothetical protein n=1 Tax=Streptomyces sp. NPDC005406 TaxID=3155339 RepID=UPI00345730BF
MPNCNPRPHNLVDGWRVSGGHRQQNLHPAAGDSLALIVPSCLGSGGTPRVPFHQTVILQNQLLG